MIYVECVEEMALLAKAVQTRLLVTGIYLHRLMRVLVSTTMFVEYVEEMALLAKVVQTRLPVTGI
jgi:hypothetical protein